MRKNRNHTFMKKAAALLTVLTMTTAGAGNAFAANTLICEKEGPDISDILLTVGNSELAKIPDQVREKLAEDGWEFLITEKNLAATYYPDGKFASLAGITVITTNGPKTIYIENRETAVSRSVIHETGHAVDYELSGEKGLLSAQEEFMNIFNEEKDTFTDITSAGDGHEYSNAQEYFASAWCNYCRANRRLKAQAPKTYAYIEKVFCQYAGVSDVSDFTYEALSGSHDPEFDANVYYGTYEDLRTSIGMDKDALYNHYLNYGKAEGRIAVKN